MSADSCGGDWKLGTACGRCDRCKSSAHGYIVSLQNYVESLETRLRDKTTLTVAKLMEILEKSPPGLPVLATVTDNGDIRDVRHRVVSVTQLGSGLVIINLKRELDK